MTHAVFGWDDHIEVDMVFIGTDGIEVPVWIVFAHFFKFDPEVGIDAFGKPLPAISGHPHEMVLGFVIPYGLVCGASCFRCTGRGRA